MSPIPPPSSPSQPNGLLKPLPDPPPSSPAKNSLLPASFGPSQLLSFEILSSQPPASYSQHLAALLIQSLTAASITSTKTWSSFLLTSVLAVPFSRWIDPLARTQREHLPSRTRPSSTLPPPSSDAEPPSSSAAPPPTSLSLAQQLSLYLPTIPNFQPYPFAAVEEPDQPVVVNTYQTPRKPSALHIVPGAFPTGLSSPVSPSPPSPFGRPSADSLANQAALEDARMEIERKEMEGKRVVLGITIWVVDKPEGGEKESIEWVEGRWAVEESSVAGEQDEGGEGSKTPTRRGGSGTGGFDGLPGGEDSAGLGGLNLMMMGSGEPTVKKEKKKEKGKGREGKGRLLFGLEKLDLTLDPKEYHLVGGTFVVHGSPDATTLASLEKVIRIGLYTHLSNALELSLLVAHSRILDPPAPTPSLFARFQQPVVEPSSPQSIDSDSERGSEHHWGAGGNRRSKTGSPGGRWTRTWGGLIGALVGGVKGAPKKGRLGVGLGPEGKSQGTERPFSSLSTVLIEHDGSGASSSSTFTAGGASTASTSTNLDGSVTPINPTTPPTGQPGMDKFSKACLMIQSTIFSTSPNVSFPPPPLLVRLREAESRAALAPAAPTSSYLTRQDASAVAMEFGDDGKSSDAERLAADARRLGDGGAGVFRLTGEARVGMASLLLGNGSLAAFGRHQSISVLYQVLPLSHPSLSASAHPSSFRPNSPGPSRSPLLRATTPITPVTPAHPETLSDSTSISSSYPSPTSDPTPAPAATSAIPSCVHPSWKTLTYFSAFATNPDSNSPSLGGLIRSLAFEARSGVTCVAPGCTRSVAEEHKRIWMHAGTRVMAGAKVLEKERDLEKEELEEVEGVLVEAHGEGDAKERIDCWVECVECGAKTEGKWMSEAAGLFSFAKYLELLIYADSAYPKDLCAHTRSSPVFFSPASTAQSSPLLRRFRSDGVVVTFEVDVFDIFELRLGKLMVGPSSLPKNGAGGGESDARDRMATREAQAEIEDFYCSLEKRMSAIKSHLLGPILSSASFTTEKPPPLPPKEALSIASPAFASLRKLSLVFRKDESTVMASLRSVTPSTLNDARKLFVDKALEAKARLESWEKKHASDLKTLLIDKAAFNEPDYLSQKGVHLLPGSSVILREDEPASIIAHILSSQDYHRELAKLRPIAGLLSQPPTPRFEDQASFFSKPVPPEKDRHRSPSMKAKALPPSPPGSSDTIADAAAPAADAWTLEITRPEPPRDLSTAILSLRPLTKKPSSGMISLNAPGLLAPNRMGTLAKASVSTGADKTLLSLDKGEAKGTHDGKASEPDVRGSVRRLRGQLGKADVDGDATNKTASSASHFLESSQDSINSTTSSSSSSSSSTTSLLDSKPPSSYNRPPSVMSGFSDFSISSSTSPAARKVTTTIDHRRSETSSSTDSNATINGSVLGLGYPSTEASTTSSTPSTTPARRFSPPSAAPSSILGWGSSKDESWTSSITSGIGNSLSSILGMGTGSFRGKKEQTGSRASSIHSMMSGGGEHVEEKPHIQFAYAIGTKLKISCTVYFASSFDVLRRKLGVEKAIIESLSRTSKWEAQGGKSKALFFKTQDQRYIVKELLSKWNVSDVQALLEIAPSYFEFINGASTKPTALAKIIGFYTCKINNLETGAATKRDLLVMENIFFDQDVSKTFDLKGIEGRRVKTTAGHAASEVGHDREWVEGQQKTLLVVHPHSKRILREALAHDAKFLAANSIVDFSLLVGVDEEKKELAVGLVDAIGAFTFFKALESKGKQLASKGLASNKGGATQVTVLPPDQYGARFEAAMDAYFVACPDKFSAPMNANPTSKGKKPTIGGVPSIF